MKGNILRQQVEKGTEEKQDERYVKLFTDSYFNYYMDKKMPILKVDL